jgi:hypothetical protein
MSSKRLVKLIVISDFVSQLSLNQRAFPISRLTCPRYPAVSLTPHLSLSPSHRHAPGVSSDTASFKLLFHNVPTFQYLSKSNFDLSYSIRPFPLRFLTKMISFQRRLAENDGRIANVWQWSVVNPWASICKSSKVILYSLLHWSAWVSRGTIYP